MEWTFKEPKKGDMIRVRVSFYFHYGIYEDDEHVYAFGKRDNSGVNPDDIEILFTDITEFLGGDRLETAVLSHKEKKKALKPQQVIEYARSRLGEKGYNILHNNCEHFANACLFGEAKSDFVDEVRSEIIRKIQ